MKNVHIDIAATINTGMELNMIGLIGGYYIMTKQLKINRKTAFFLENMFRGYMEQIGVARIPLDPKYYDSVEDVKELINILFMIRASNEEGFINITME